MPLGTDYFILEQTDKLSVQNTSVATQDDSTSNKVSQLETVQHAKPTRKYGSMYFRYFLTVHKKAQKFYHYSDELRT